MRRLIANQLERHRLSPADVTDLLLTQAHYDHSINSAMFSNARIAIGAEEPGWAVAQPFDHALVELYSRDLALSLRTQTVVDGEQGFPGMTAHRAPGDTPGHLVFMIFTGDAAKNRVEPFSSTADMKMNKNASVANIERIRELWRERPDAILLPGHDIPMILENRRPAYIEISRAGLTAWFDDNLEQSTLFELKAASPAPSHSSVTVISLQPLEVPLGLP